jgi:protein-S-isoprenylcysteine O-methyltransferase Ste14
VSTVITRFGLVLVIGAVILLAITGDLFSSSLVVTAAQLSAIALTIWARRSFPPNSFRADATPSAESVIRRGPYRLIRHPMYSGALLFIWASVLSHLIMWTMAIGVIVTVIIVLRVVFEERYLRSRYPEYFEYVKVTKAFIPYLI